MTSYVLCKTGSLAVFKVTARDQGHYKGPSGAFVTYCNISCFFFFFCFFFSKTNVFFFVVLFRLGIRYVRKQPRSQYVPLCKIAKSIDWSVDLGLTVL